MSCPDTRLTGLYAVFAAVAVTLLVAAARPVVLRDRRRAEELEVGSVSGWAEPGRDLAGGLLTWASPDRVYATYVQLFALLFPAVFLCARAVRARRRPTAAASSAEAGGSAWPATGCWPSACSSCRSA